jgi:sodium pump decarboxylase gamma subunit
MQAQPILSSTSVLDTLPHLAGMVMVLVTLTILWGVCAMTAKLVQILNPEPKPAAASQAAPAKPTAAVKKSEPRADFIAPEVVAVIAAAVSTTLGQKVRIISIKPTSTQWERAGRQSVLTSHRIR